MSNWTQEAQPLIENSILAGGLWLTATYVYLYSDIVVRRIGLYLALAGFSLVMAELTLLFGMNLQSEWVIAILALTALAINVFHGQFVTLNEKLDRVIPPLALVLSGLPLLCSLMLHFRATSTLAAEYHWGYPTGWAFVVAALIVAASNRISSYLCRKTNPRLSATYFAFNAAAVLIAVAGLLRELGIVTWSHQAPWLMVIPVVYLIASRLWRGHTAERPLAWIAQVATALILVCVLFTFRQEEGTSLPAKGEGGNLMLGLVFAEATIFYVLAGLFRKRSANVYLAAATACCALWQLLGYLGIDSRYHTMLYAVLGAACLAGARILGLEKATIFGDDGQQRQTINGRGRAVFQSGNGILIVACLAAFLQGLSGLHVGTATWFDLGALAVTTIASALAIGFVPSGTWRSLYTAATIALAAVAFLRLNLLIDLSNWQKLEIFCVTAGIVMLIASHIARFREIEGVRDETVSLGLWLGSMLATGPLLIAFSYHRWIGVGPSLQDEMALLTVTILMVVTGVSWQMKATTLCGGSLLTFYLIKLIVSLAYRPQVAIGVYLALGGAIIFAVGIALSIYREKLLVVSKQISQREGMFQILTWR
jgi:hypothetical protein